MGSLRVGHDLVTEQQQQLGICPNVIITPVLFHMHVLQNPHRCPAALSWFLSSLAYSVFIKLCSLTPSLLPLAGYFREPLFHCSHSPPIDGPPTATNRTSVSISLALRTWRRISPGCVCVGGVGLQIPTLTLA